MQKSASMHFKVKKNITKILKEQDKSFDVE